MEYLIGVVLAAVVCAFGLLTGFDRERVFYPTILIVVATYYILFAAMGSSTPALTIESTVAGAFLIAALVGFKKNLWLVVSGLVGHGVFDFFHHMVIQNPGVPVWWPGFCLSIRRRSRYRVGGAAGEAFRLCKAHCKVSDRRTSAPLKAHEALKKGEYDDHPKEDARDCRKRDLLRHM